MFNLVSLLVAAALVSLQCGFEANAQIDSKQLDNNINNIKVDVVPSHKRPSKFVSIKQSPPETARLSNTPLELTCEVLGSPVPTVQWLKNGEPISDYLDESNEITTEHPSSVAWLLSTLVVTSAATGDVFTCVATTGFSTKTASTTVYTEQDDTDMPAMSLFTVPSKPILSLYYMQLYQDIGSNAVLPCRVYSPLEPQVYWQDKHHNIIYGNSRMRVLPSGDLFIANIRWTDMGDYTCVAKNLYGKTIATSFLYPTKPKH